MQNLSAIVALTEFLPKKNWLLIFSSHDEVQQRILLLSSAGGVRGKKWIEKDREDEKNESE